MVWAALIAFVFGPTCGFIFALVCGPIFGWACALSVTGRAAEVDRVVHRSIAWSKRTIARIRPPKRPAVLEEVTMDLDLDADTTAPAE